MFAGFTEEDLDSDKGPLGLRRQTKNNTQSSNGGGGGAVTRKPLVARSVVGNSNQKLHPVPEGAMLSMSTKSPEKSPNSTEKLTNSPEKSTNLTAKALDSIKEEQPQNPDIIQDLANSEDNKLEENNVSEDKKANIERLQELQKKMEEENKKKKALLIKAIADRRQKSNQESEKLKQIQFELSKIDASLTSDVAQLRDCIEEASYQFMEAKKRYDRAETEFVSAKLNLHVCGERKELLTEHLCQIIQKNEERKAEKLTKLMLELDITEE